MRGVLNILTAICGAARRPSGSRRRAFDQGGRRRRWNL